MKDQDALQIVSSFKGKNLKQKLNELKKNLVGKGKNDIVVLDEVFEAALKVKTLSAQIDEVVHSTGIIKCLPHILLNDELIVEVSLAAGAEGEGIDLVTTKRIAEFKFSRWQEGVANGMRKRQVFADLVNLYLNPITKKKELYVYDASKITAFFQSKKAQWKNVLSKSGGLDRKLKAHFMEIGVSGNFLNDVYSISNVKVIDIEDILNY